MPLRMCCAGLLGEGAVQVLYSTDDFRTEPILAAVGQLQFEVVQVRPERSTAVETVTFCTGGAKTSAFCSAILLAVVWGGRQCYNVV